MATNLPLKMGASIISDRKLPVVNSYNEWDTLQEVILGRVEGSVIPQF
jgi:glycine amidinotransferase